MRDHLHFIPAFRIQKSPPAKQFLLTHTVLLLFNAFLAIIAALNIVFILTIFGFVEFLMPIYEYQCAACHHQFDVLQKMNDEPIKKCPKCSQDTVERQVSAAGFQLKGSGWYATDFKNKGKPEQKSETSSASSSDTKAADKKVTNTTAAPSSTTKGE